MKVEVSYPFLWYLFQLPVSNLNVVCHVIRCKMISVILSLHCAPTNIWMYIVMLLSHFNTFLFISDRTYVFHEYAIPQSIQETELQDFFLGCWRFLSSLLIQAIFNKLINEYTLNPGFFWTSDKISWKISIGCLVRLLAYSFEIFIEFLEKTLHLFCIRLLDISQSTGFLLKF